MTQFPHLLISIIASNMLWEEARTAEDKGKIIHVLKQE